MKRFIINNNFEELSDFHLFQIIDKIIDSSEFKSKEHKSFVSADYIFKNGTQDDVYCVLYRLNKSGSHSFTICKYKPDTHEFVSKNWTKI